MLIMPPPGLGKYVLLHRNLTDWLMNHSLWISITRDISPWLQARGLLSSLRGFPTSLRLAWLSFCPSRSYSLSIGSHRESRGQNVLCGIAITVMDHPTCGAYPRADIKR